MRLHDYFDYYAREYPDAGFAIFGTEKLTYSEASGRINRLFGCRFDGGSTRALRKSRAVRNRGALKNLANRGRIDLKTSQGGLKDAS